jgi:hypothetical protein
LDNNGGLSGFCVGPVSPSLSPSLSTAPSLLASESPTALPSSSPAPSLSPSSNPTYKPCDDGLSTVRIEMTTDDFPGETSWKLVDDATGNAILQGGNYTGAFKTFVSQTCISNDACHYFTINDSNGDGVFYGGGYVIYANNEQVASGGGNFGSSEIVKIGECNTLVPSMTPALTTNPTATGDNSDNNNNNADDEPLLTCQDSMVNFTVEITIENDPERVAWTLVDTHSDSTPIDGDGNTDASILLQGGPYNDNDILDVNDEETTTTASRFVQSVCVASDACLVLEIQDPETTQSTDNEFLLGSVSFELILATVNLYANGSKIAVAGFDGSTATTKEVGACSPIQ